MGVRLVKEGLVELALPDDPQLDRQLGPGGKRGGAVFYNPASRPSRDLTILAMRALPAPPKGWRVLDGLCGSGVRGLRVLKEVAGVSEVTLNDGNPAAAKIAQEQAQRVGDERVRVTNRSLEETLADPAALFDFIDIDPYGSPVRFLTAAAGRVARGGYIALTATDLGALCGAFPHACLRRYGAAPLHNEWMKETAARILLGAAARKAAAIDRTIEPVLTIATLHFIRAIYRVDKDRRAGKAGARHLGFVKPDPEYREAPRVVGLEQLLEDASALAGKGPAAGPLWTGPLHSPPLLAKIGRPGRSPATGENEGPMEAWPFRHFLEAAPGESEMPPYFFSLDEAARRLKTSPPTTAKAVEALTARGHESCRTHFDTKGVKTRASPAAFLDAVAALTHRR